MPLIDLILLLRWIEGGVFTASGLYYLFTLLYKAPDIPKGGRRRFTVTVSWLFISLGIDCLISALIGGPVNYVANGGSYIPVVFVLIARAVTIGVALLFVRASWRTWSRAQIA